MSRLSRPLQQLRSHYDVAVIGSGYGGGVAASRFARTGKRVAVLERGREIATGEFPRRFSDLRSEMQLSGRLGRIGSPTGLYDIRVGEDMHVLVGCGLGGGSLINAGVTLRPDARVFQDDVWPRQVARDGLLDDGFAQARAWLRPARDPAATMRTKYQALRAASGAVQAQTLAAPVAVSFNDTINPAGVFQPACTGCGDCCGGCNVGAKNTVALTYLPDAAGHSAEIFTGISVRYLSREQGGRWRVHFDAEPGRGDDAEGVPPAITAEFVVLAAGTLGSSEILLRSREHGLALSDHLGHGFSANGDVIAFGYGASRPVNAIGVGHPAKIQNAHVGACVSGQLEIMGRDDLAESVVIQEGTLPSALAPVLPALFLPNGRLLGALQSLIAGVYHGPFRGLQTFFAASHDSASGRLQLVNDRLELAWPGAKEEPVYKRVDATLEALVRQSGGSYVKNPLARTMMGSQPVTAHPLGGCRMGHDRECGVVNHKGQVFDGRVGADPTDVHHGLYVMDGSVIPRSLGVNPLLTITALAERTMLHIAADNNLAALRALSVRALAASTAA